MEEHPLLKRHSVMNSVTRGSWMHLTLYLSTMTVLMRLVCLLSWWHCCLKQFLACGSNSISWERRTCHIHWCNLVTENSIPLVFILPRIYHRDHFSSDTSEESMCLTFLILVGWQVRFLFMAETYKDTLFYISGESFLSCGRLKLFFFCCENGNALLPFPLHTSLKLQPLLLLNPQFQLSSVSCLSQMLPELQASLIHPTLQQRHNLSNLC